MPSIIIPTPGRVVLYRPASSELGRFHVSPFTLHDADAPCAAIVSFVHNERLVNLSVFDQNGVQHARQSVRLVQPDEAPSAMPDADTAWCHWMAYQLTAADVTQQALPLDPPAPAPEPVPLQPDNFTTPPGAAPHEMAAAFATQAAAAPIEAPIEAPTPAPEPVPEPVAEVAPTVAEPSNDAPSAAP